MTTTTPRWPVADVIALYQQPLMDLLWQAQRVHREHHVANEVQLSSLLSIKTGGCPEDCSYCPQSSKYDTGLEKERVLELDRVVQAAKTASWRSHTVLYGCRLAFTHRGATG